MIIVDNGVVITGSFNFTKAAQEENAENLLIIYDKSLAEKYIENWRAREAHSVSPEAVKDIRELKKYRKIWLLSKRALY